MILQLFISLVIYPYISQPAAVYPDHIPRISHEEWNALLMKYVSENGVVNYKGIKADQPKLHRYLDLLKNTNPSSDWSREEKMVYWINTYNAFTVELIIENYPLKSISDLKNGKPWDDPFIQLGGKKYSLNNIEHDILRKEFGDPRIHFAINCASKSCPKLLNRAFSADQLEMQLNGAARSFLADPSKNKIAPDHAEISEIFKWYSEDFTKNGSLTDFLAKFSGVRISSNATISYLKYDWSLNE